jgi:hypothetical protein
MLTLSTVGVLAGNETQCTTSEFSTSGFLCLKASEVTIISDYNSTECSTPVHTYTNPPGQTDIVSYFLDYSIGNAYYESPRPASNAQFLVGTNSNQEYCACFLDYYSAIFFEVTIDATYSRKGKGHFFAEETTVQLKMTRCSS